jgi:hypothetical protein
MNIIPYRETLEELNIPDFNPPNVLIADYNTNPRMKNLSGNSSVNIGSLRSSQNYGKTRFKDNIDLISNFQTSTIQGDLGFIPKKPASLIAKDNGRSVTGTSSFLHHRVSRRRGQAASLSTHLDRHIKDHHFRSVQTSL